MPRRVRLLRRRSWALAAGAAVVLGLLAAPTATAAPATCATQVNDTVAKLVPCITTDDLWDHMVRFQAIADANPGPDGHASRNSGEPGYKASVDYVAGVMTAAGYKVTIQSYKFTYFTFTAPPVFQEFSPVARTFTLGTDWNPGQAPGTADHATIAPAGGIVIPPTATPSSASGCSPGDFAGVAGHIALIQRGTCTFGTKVVNAQAAGAVGTVIFNEGNPGRTDVFSGSLVDAAGNPVFPTIPVAFVSFADGKALLDQFQAGTPPVMTENVKAIVTPNADDFNVIAESKGGDPNHVLVVDAHLDAIFGAGMLDNASGSATILDVAQQMKNVNPLNKLRFIWFGGEELGLLGSNFYVNNLAQNDLNHIGYDLDADVTATPNYLIGVLDPAAPDLFSRTVSATFPNRVYKPSMVARDQAIAYFNSVGLNHELLSPVGTDAFSFNAEGIPASGLLTGQDCCKTAGDVRLFGGTTGLFEGFGTPGGCVDNPFLWCDNLTNNDQAVLTFMSKAFATMVVQMAFDTNIMSSSNNSVIKTKLPTKSDSKRFVTR